VSSASKPVGSAQAGVFTHGSIMRHVLTMTSTGAIGLVSIFFVDIINLFYISLLGEQRLAAAIGYAATIMFFTLSVSIGFMIAASALTARALGGGDKLAARKTAGASLVFTGAVCILVTAGIYPFLGNFLSILGARGETHAIALGFMQIALPSFPLLGIGMCLAGLLRARGDARRAMYVTLLSGLAALIVDPILIFGLDLGITGAAITIVIVRILFVIIALNGVHFVHKMIAVPDFAWLRSSVRPFFVIALPAILTQVATPIGNAYVTRAIAQFGDDAVAGWTIVGRLIPLAFAAIFALSSAVGPILSQNLGARQFDRVHQTLRDSLTFTLCYSVVIWAVLAITYPHIITLFQAKGDAALLIRFFCLFVAGSFIFNGVLFVANASFNNLGFPVFATIFNWGRATLGIIPFVWFGQKWGAEGVLAGWGVGGIMFGILAVIVCFRSLRKLPERARLEDDALPTAPSANSPFTSGKGASV